MPVFRLTSKLAFPDPHQAGPDGLLAVGGDLSPERLLLAYSLGIFPWYGRGEPLLWWSPDPRCVIVPTDIHASRRLQRSMRQKQWRITCNRAFDQVVTACAATRLERGEDTWLVPEMQAAYRRLHTLGYAHSVEAWWGDELVGGIYGVAIERFFFGESMFHRMTDASKIVLVRLCRHLAEKQVALLDCQVPNPHLLRMGAIQMPRAEFLQRLHRAGLGFSGRLPRLLLPAVL